MKELLLEHRGYTCIAKLYEDGRWGFGNSEDIEDADPDSPFDFFWFADNEEEAKQRFASSVNRMIEQQEYQKAEDIWKSSVDYKSVASVINILPNVFENRILSGQIDEALLNGVNGGDYVVPLFYITKAWDNLLKGTLGDIAFMIGPEEDDDYSEEELKLFLEEEHATRSRGEAILQNDQMKELWKKYFNIDIDSLDVDFTKFDMHMPPNVSEDEHYWYFYNCMDGVREWLLPVVNHPSETWAFHDVTSCLMEFTANIIKYERNENR